MSAVSAGTCPEHVRQLEGGPGIAEKRPLMLPESAGIVDGRPGEVRPVEGRQGAEPFGQPVADHGRDTEPRAPSRFENLEAGLDAQPVVHGRDLEMQAVLEELERRLLLQAFKPLFSPGGGFSEFREEDPDEAQGGSLQQPPVSRMAAVIGQVAGMLPQGAQHDAFHFPAGIGPVPCRSHQPQPLSHAKGRGQGLPTGAGTAVGIQGAWIPGGPVGHCPLQGRETPPVSRAGKHSDKGPQEVMAMQEMAPFQLAVGSGAPVGREAGSLPHDPAGQDP